MLTNGFSTTTANIPEGNKTIAIQPQDGSPWIKLPIGDDILDAEFSRNSNNLHIYHSDGELVVENYFATNSNANLISDSGQKITHNAVKLLAGAESPFEFAGPISIPAATESIGIVAKIKGTVIVKRAGEEIELHEGDAVYQNDVIKTDSEGSIGITFDDGSVFTLGSQARMTLDHFVYDPETGDGASSLNVIKGMFKFVSGEIAANNPGEMQIETPVATIGIRGTTGGGFVQGEGAQNQFYLEPNADGTVGWFDITTANGTVSMNQPNTMVDLNSFNEVPQPPKFVPAQQLYDAFSAVIDFAPAGKYHTRINNEAQYQQSQQQNSNANSTNSKTQAADGAKQQEIDSKSGSSQNNSENNKQTDNAQNEEAADNNNDSEDSINAESSKQSNQHDKKANNAADATSKSTQSAAENGNSHVNDTQQAATAFESFSDADNFDGNASGELPKNDNVNGDNKQPAATGNSATNDATTFNNNTTTDVDFIATGVASEQNIHNMNIGAAPTDGSNITVNIGNKYNEPNNISPQGITQFANIAGDNITDGTIANNPQNNSLIESPINNNQAISANNAVTSSFINSQLQSTAEIAIHPPTPLEPAPPTPPINNIINPLPNNTAANNTAPVIEPIPVSNATESTEAVSNSSGASGTQTSFSLTASLDNLAGNNYANYFVVSDIDTELNTGDTIIGGSSVDSLHILSQTRSYTIDLTTMTNLSGIDRIITESSAATVILNDSFMQTSDENKIYIANDSNSINITAADNITGSIVIEGSGTVSLDGNYQFHNISNTSNQSVDLNIDTVDLAIVHLNGGSNNITSDIGNVMVKQINGSNHNITTGANESYVVFDNVTNSSITGGNGDVDIFVDNSSDIVIRSGSGSLNASIEDSSNIDIDNSTNTNSNRYNIRSVDNATLTGGDGSIEEFFISGNNSNLKIIGNNGQDIYHFRGSSGNTEITAGSNDMIEIDTLSSSADITIVSDTSGSININLTDSELTNIDFQVNDANNDGKLDMEITVGASNSLLLDSFFTANYNNYSLSGKNGQTANLSDTAQYGLYTAGSITLNSMPVASDTIIIDSVTFTFVTSGAGSNQINLGTDIKSTLDNIVSTLNNDPSINSDYIFTHDNIDKLFVRSLNSQSTPGNISGTAPTTIDALSYNNYYTAKGSTSSPAMEWGNIVKGSVVDDVIKTAEAGQQLYGYDGNDLLTIGSDLVTIYGGGGNDTISAGNGTLSVSSSIYGGNGIDMLDYSGIGQDITAGLASGSTIEYGSAVDYVMDDMENFLSGSGADSISGSSASNSIDGGSGNDTLLGGGGDDTLIGGGGADSLDGGSGIDSVSYASANSGAIIDLTDSINNAGSAAGDELLNIENIIGSSFADDITGDNLDNLIEGLAGADTIDGGSGNDTVSYAQSLSAVNIDIGSTGAQSGGDAQGDILLNIESIIGSRFDDVIKTSASGNDIDAGYGDDIITLYGTITAHNIDGGSGNDTLILDLAASIDMDDLASIASNIETIDLNGNDMIDVYGYNVDSITDSSNELIIKGQGNETITLAGISGDWLQIESEMTGFSTYVGNIANNAVEVHIADNITVNMPA